MIPDLNKVAIYLKPGATDMRKQINGLATSVADIMQQNTLSGDIFLFCSRDRTIIKALYWDNTGFCLWQKRLERHRFPWPRNTKAAQQISRRELEMLLSGIDFFNVHQQLKFSAVQ